MTGKNKLIDNIINHESSTAFVEMVFLDDGGNEHTIQRQKDKTAQTLMLDGIEGTSKERVEQIVGDQELWLSRFNPYYFNEILKPEKQREYIVKFAPIIDMESLFATKAHRDFIAKYQIQLNKPTEAKRFRDMVRQMESQLTAYYSELQVLMQQNNTPIAPYLPVDEATAAQLKQQVDAYHNAEIDNSKIGALWARYNESLQRQATLQQQIAEIQSKLASLMPVVKPPEYSQDQIIAALDAELNSLQNVPVPQFQDISTIETCPLCYTQISPEHKSHVLQHQTSEISRTTSENQVIEARRQDVKRRQAERMSELNSLAQKYQEYLFQKGQFETQINTLTAEATPVEMPTQGLYDISAYPSIVEQYEKIVSSNQTARIHNAESQQLQNQANERNARIAAINDNVKLIESNKSEVAQIAEALNPNTGIYRIAIEQKTEAIRSEFKNVTIELERLVKSTGDFKEVFEIYWEGREYWTISRSEKIRCGLEIGNFLSSKSGRNIPVFIDDAESITYIEPEYIQADQIFYSKVTKGQSLDIQVQ